MTVPVYQVLWVVMCLREALSSTINWIDWGSIYYLSAINTS